jgi:hypothetical protein
MSRQERQSNSRSSPRAPDRVGFFDEVLLAANLCLVDIAENQLLKCTE